MHWFSPIKIFLSSFDLFFFTILESTSLRTGIDKQNQNQSNLNNTQPYLYWRQTVWCQLFCGVSLLAADVTPKTAMRWFKRKNEGKQKITSLKADCFRWRPNSCVWADRDREEDRKYCEARKPHVHSYPSLSSTSAPLLPKIQQHVEGKQIESIPLQLHPEDWWYLLETDPTLLQPPQVLSRWVSAKLLCKLTPSPPPPNPPPDNACTNLPATNKT